MGLKLTFCSEKLAFITQTDEQTDKAWGGGRTEQLIHANIFRDREEGKKKDCSMLAFIYRIIIIFITQQHNQDVALSTMTNK